MGRPRKNAAFSVREKRGKNGIITVITHTNGFRSLAVSGKVKTAKGLTDSFSLYSFILSVGYDLLHLFPSLFTQRKSSTIITYSLPVTSEKRNTLSGFRYSFQYTLNGGTDTDTAIQQLLPEIEKTNARISAYMKQVLSQASCP